MKKNIYKLMLELTHNRLYTAILKRFTQLKVSKLLIPSFSRTFHINEAELARNLPEYDSLSDFFSRELKEGSRFIGDDKNEIISPVDGVIKDAGKITKDTDFFVKGKKHSLKTMLGIDSAVNRYANGNYCVLYLSPKDYHRIHSPSDGVIIHRWALGRYSEPVNSMGLHYGIEPLATNYRLITEMVHKDNRMALIKVGALNVNSIHPSHLKNKVEKGEEIGYFSFGSTVILLFEKNSITFNSEVIEGELNVKQGESIGKWVKS
ncbi:phosphatidylserine decarboxylase [Salipaludibacillus sp. HK11]|uniref:phosphatidylserine decarboxylase n=1 Tax=Salipaludibacillus sp. HK11 TaxID=3394320 RepID=UPI0039FB949E